MNVQKLTGTLLAAAAGIAVSAAIPSLSASADWQTAGIMGDLNGDKQVNSADLVIMARSDDGLVEGAYLPGYRYVFGVQWHSEFTAASDDASMTLFRHFVEVCRG